MKYQIIPVSGDTFQIISEFRGLAIISKNIIDGGGSIISIYKTPPEGRDFGKFLLMSEVDCRISVQSPSTSFDLICSALDCMHSDVRAESSNRSNIEEVDWIVVANTIISPDMASLNMSKYIKSNEAKDYEDVVQIPLGFNDTLRKVVRAHINYIKATQADTDESETDSRTMHDLHTWEALLSHPLSINISQKKIDSFCNVHGIDFPMFN